MPTAQRLCGNWLSRRRAVGADQVKPWKIAPEASRVAGQQPVTGNGRMRADKEIGQRRGPNSATAAIFAEGLAREKRRFKRD